MSDDMVQGLPLVATQFIVQLTAEGATVVVGQGVVAIDRDGKGMIKPNHGTAWHTQLFLPPSSLKTLAESLNKAIADYESKVGSIPTPAKSE